jgi:hypothetical protein
MIKRCVNGRRKTERKTENKGVRWTRKCGNHGVKYISLKCCLAPQSPANYSYPRKHETNLLQRQVSIFVFPAPTSLPHTFKTK